MARAIWNGEGELKAGEAYWEIASGWNRGALVGRKYIRRRVVSFLARHQRDKSPEFSQGSDRAHGRQRRVAGVAQRTDRAVDLLGCIHQLSHGE